MWFGRALAQTGRGKKKQTEYSRDISPLILAQALNGAGVLAWSQGDYPSAQNLLEESLLIFREINDKSGIAWSLYGLGVVSLFHGDSNTARAFFEESLDFFRKLGHRGSTAWLVNNLGHVTRNLT